MEHDISNISKTELSVFGLALGFEADGQLYLIFPLKDAIVVITQTILSSISQKSISLSLHECLFIIIFMLSFLCLAFPQSSPLFEFF